MEDVFISYMEKNVKELYENNKLNHFFTKQPDGIYMMNDTFELLNQDLKPVTYFYDGNDKNEVSLLLLYMDNKFFSDLSLKEKQKILKDYFEYDKLKIITKYKILNLLVNTIIDGEYGINIYMYLRRILKSIKGNGTTKQWENFYFKKNFFSFFKLPYPEVIKLSKEVMKEKHDFLIMVEEMKLQSTTSTTTSGYY
jgi:hypothetical protein